MNSAASGYIPSVEDDLAEFGLTDSSGPAEPIETVLPVTPGDGQDQASKPSLKATVTVKITHTGQFLVSGGNLTEEVRFHSEWQLAAFFTEMGRDGQLRHLKPFSKTQTYDEWLALGNQPKVIKPTETKPVPKDSTGKCTITLEDLGL